VCAQRLLARLNEQAATGLDSGATARSRAHERATGLLASSLCAAAALPGVFDALEATRAFAACQEGPAHPGQGDRTD
jgi:hypothetical protein